MNVSMQVRPSIRRFLLWVGPVLLLLAIWQAWGAIERNRLEQQLARTFPEGLVDRRGAWEEENAARYYTAASSAVLWPADARFQPSAVTWGTRDFLLRGEPLAVTGSAEAFDLVARNQLSLELVERAGDLPFGEFRPGTEFNYRFSGLLQVGQLAALKTLLAIQRGDAVVAVASVMARAKLVRAFDADGRMFGATAASREWQGIASDTALLMTRTQPPDTLLEELSNAFQQIVPTDVERVVKQESLARYDALRQASGDRGGRNHRVGPVVSPVLLHHAVGMLQVAADARDAVRLQWPDRITAMHAKPERRSVLPEITPFVAAWRLQSLFRDLVPRVGVGVAAVRCARLAVAIEQHRRSHGALPARLDDLTEDPGGDAHLDPFTGKPLLYQPSSAGYVLYSVGPDGRDDGGQVLPRPMTGRILGMDRTPDVGVRYVNSASDALPRR